jgi:branched-chain amino acid transport system ATP-binding protein
MRAGLDLFPELAPHLDRPVRLLSGGQQQMLVMARTLAARPRVLLADELSLGLAPLITGRLFEAITAAAAGGVGVLLVEQQVTLAIDAAHRGYVLRGGRIVMSGPSARLRASAEQLEEAYLGGLPSSAQPETGDEAAEG